MKQHDAALRSKAVELAKELGAAEAARQLNLSRGTVSGWLSKSGHGAVRSAQTRAATEQKILSRQERIARLQDKLLEDAERLRESLWEPAKVHHWGTTTDREDGRITRTVTEFMEHEIAEPTFGDKKNILLSAAIAIDKSQLLAGEATSRSEVTGAEEARKNIQALRERLSGRAELRVVGENG